MINAVKQGRSRLSKKKRKKRILGVDTFKGDKQGKRDHSEQRHGDPKFMANG